MKCPECQFDNREGARFCSECGCEFVIECPKCASKIRAESKFCDECGYDIIAAKEIADEASDIKVLSITPSDDIPTADIAPIVGERKHVTVLFSDLTGYTSMGETDKENQSSN